MNKKKGFTIIEVSLVLAIAGLIMLLVFIALPGLQRSQRDSRRKDDIMKLADSIKKYQSNNNRGNLPEDATELKNNVVIPFIGGSFADPDGDEYEYIGGECPNTVTTGNKCAEAADRPTIVYTTGASCGDNHEAIKVANKRKATLIYKLESGESGWCYEL